MDNERFLLIFESDADFLFPDGWTEEELRQRGFLLNKPIDEDGPAFRDAADKNGE